MGALIPHRLGAVMNAGLVILIVVVVVAIALFAVLMARRRRTEGLRERFGPEYERTVARAGDRRAAESELADREHRRKEFTIVALEPAVQSRYQQEWRATQARFVDDPPGATRDADVLVARVMQERGYPVDADFERQAADVSVDHPQVAENYRAAHAVLPRQRAGAGQHGRPSPGLRALPVPVFRALGRRRGRSRGGPPVKDRSDELSTADLAGQSAGSGGADERAVRGEGRSTGRASGTTASRVMACRGRRLRRRPAATTPTTGPAGRARRPGGHAGRPAAYADDPTAASPAARRRPVAGDRSAGDGPAAGGAGYAGDRAGATRPDPAVVGDRAGYGDAGRTGPAGGAGDAAVPRRRLTGAGDRRARGRRGAAERDGRPATVREPAAGNGGRPGTAVGRERARGPLLRGAETEGFRARWTDVQTGFVDEPRRAVEQADGLVAELMQHLAKTFADERSRLEGQWDRGEDIHTDDLRTAFQRYRSFFERLLST